MLENCIFLSYPENLYWRVSSLLDASLNLWFNVKSMWIIYIKKNKSHADTDYKGHSDWILNQLSYFTLPYLQDCRHDCHASEFWPLGGTKVWLKVSKIKKIGIRGHHASSALYRLSFEWYTNTALFFVFTKMNSLKTGYLLQRPANKIQLLMVHKINYSKGY